MIVENKEDGFKELLCIEREGIKTTISILNGVILIQETSQGASKKCNYYPIVAFLRMFSLRGDIFISNEFIGGEGIIKSIRLKSKDYFRLCSMGKAFARNEKDR
jgi:hypothetical protein